MSKHLAGPAADLGTRKGNGRAGYRRVWRPSSLPPFSLTP
jgi:hypothetical protein